VCHQLAPCSPTLKTGLISRLHCANTVRHELHLFSPGLACSALTLLISLCFGRCSLIALGLGKNDFVR
jgi:hypothetical protein